MSDDYERFLVAYDRNRHVLDAYYACDARERVRCSVGSMRLTLAVWDLWLHLVL